MPCEGAAKKWLMMVNFLTALFGVIICGGAGYGLAKLEDYGEYLNKTMLFVGIGFGVLVMAVSAIGCIGASKQHRGLLALYLFALFIVTVVSISSGAMVLAYRGDIGDASVNNSANAAVEKAIHASYNKCCFNKEACAGAGATEGVTWNTVTVPITNADTTSGSTALLTATCSTGVTFDDAANTDLTSFAKLYELAQCAPLKLIKFGGVKIVDAASAGGCGGDKTALLPKGNIAKYTENFEGFLKENLNTVGLVLAVIGGFEVITWIMACSLLCMNKDEFEGDI
jgi:hypothetical protein